MESQPIVVKRVKKHVHGAHGGSWKVAFADFMTALMAFFLVMWLINSGTPQQKAAISKYFNQPFGVGLIKASEDGPGGSSSNVIAAHGNMGNATSVISLEAAYDNPVRPDERSSQVLQLGSWEKEKSDDLKKEKEKEKEKEKKRLEALKEELQKDIGASQALAPFKEQLLIDITPEGLRIQIIDKENRPMFALGSIVLAPYFRAILRELANTITKVPNRISITGHTDSTPYTVSTDYTNWELSSDRANAARRELIEGKLPEEKIARVVGLASSVPFDKTNPLNPTNRRINIIVMTKEAEEAALKSEGAVVPETNAPPPAAAPAAH